MNVLALIFLLLYLCLAHCMPWCSYLGGSGEKSPSKDMKEEEEKKKKIQLSNLSQKVFLLENPTNWGLETAVQPIFAKPDIFAVDSLVPSTNLFQKQQSYLRPEIKITY